MQEPRETVTRLLMRLHGADAETRGETLRQVVELLYPELRRLASGMMRRERQGHTLQPTALVHEAFLDLVDQSSVDWEGRAHFMASAARVMRHILVDHARGRASQKRGGGLPHLTLDETLGVGTPGRSLEILHLDQALDRLAALDARAAQVIELRVFGGLTVDEAAAVLGVSKRTVDADWSVARMWLARELSASAGESS